jgi:hypothetical protein
MPLILSFIYNNAKCGTSWTANDEAIATYIQYRALAPLGFLEFLPIQIKAHTL